MTDAFELLAAHHPEAVVARDPGRVTRAAELVAHVEGVSALLPEAGDGEQVVVLCRDRYRFAVAMLAAWERGYSVALPPSAQLDAVREIRHRPSVRTVIHDVDGIDRGLDVRAATVVQAARERVGRSPFRDLGPYPADRRLATVYTSGSTAEPLACDKTAGQLLGEARLLSELFGLGPGDRFLPMVPPHHIYGLLFGVLVPLISGGSFARRTPLHAPEVAALAQEGLDVLITVPVHLRGLLSAREGELPTPRRVFSSGAPLSPRVAKAVEGRLGWTITEVFGSTETGGIGWRTSGGEGPWRPLPGVRVQAAADETMRLDSPFLAPGEPRPRAAADMIRVDEDGTFVHLGRADGVLKVGGVRVSVAEIERRLGELEGVDDAAALGVKVEGARGVEIWVAVVAPGLDAKAIRRGLSRWLAPVAMPRRIKSVASLPREANGKLPRSALMALFERKDTP